MAAPAAASSRSEIAPPYLVASGMGDPLAALLPILFSLSCHRFPEIRCEGIDGAIKDGSGWPAFALRFAPRRCGRLAPGAFAQRREEYGYATRVGQRGRSVLRPGRPGRADHLPPWLHGFARRVVRPDRAAAARSLPLHRYGRARRRRQRPSRLG